jgi:DNA modification methylase
MQAGSYRLKKHAEKHFWEWVASWAVCISKPSDIGGDDTGFILPALNISEHRVEVKHDPKISGTLFPDVIQSATMLYSNLRQSINERCLKAQELIQLTSEGCIVWCHTNQEADLLKKLIPEAVEVRGSEMQDNKEIKLKAFTEGEYKTIITKPKLGGYGLNWQHCHNVIFVSMDYSYEMLYQAIRRSYRFGQKSTVNVHIITSNLDAKVIETVKNKEEAHKKMQTYMVEAMRNSQIENIKGNLKLTDKSEYKKSEGENWTLYNGDSCELLSEIETDSVDFSIYSPPFVGLYIYSDSIRDLGNCSKDEEFYEQYKFIIDEMYRVTRPGRLSAVHCKNLVKYKNRDGRAGIKDFRGDIIRLHQDYGFELHSEVVIWKDPVIEMQRTKAHGLLHRQVCKDASFSRQGIPEYLLIFRKWDGEPEKIRAVEHKDGFDYYIGEEPPTIKGDKKLYSIHVWQRYASPVWFDISQTNVLNKRCAKDNDDERHICPLQLDVIRKAIHLWTNPNDIVLSPFAGIGSEGYIALEEGRRFIGIELKESYFKQAENNLKRAVAKNLNLFNYAESEAVKI